MHTVPTSALRQRVRIAAVSLLMAVHSGWSGAAIAADAACHLQPLREAEGTQTSNVQCEPAVSLNDQQLTKFRGLGADVMLPAGVTLWDEYRCCTPLPNHRSNPGSGFDAVKVIYQ